MLCTADESIRCETVLLGELNIKNIVLCAAVCLYLGLSMEQVQRGIRKLKPVEHRLQLISGAGGITIIDDAFNSNILGAEHAFRVLKDFSGKRIAVTPGMVELGDQEERMNHQFGTLMAGCCDEAILIGRKRSGAIREGLLEKGFSAEHIHIAERLSDAAEMLKTMAVSGDVILFENDLPDHYTE